ncbi:MAG: Ldh family oxidoreductase [Lentisphaerae bacterium]|nr:Ldh family oxidoreductase [Lentisphaerota bacterium]
MSSQASNGVKFPVELLNKSCKEVFTAIDVPAADAEMIADTLVLTDMRGVYSHGVIRSAHYIDCIQAGGIKPTAELQILNESPCAIRTSAAGGLGIPAAIKATDLAMERAKQHGVAVVTVNHSDHYGAAGIYAMRCADQGLFGMSMSNTCPLVAPTGGAKATIGNNPFSYAAPGGKYRAILFDICMSVVATGKMIIAAAEGKKIPEDWIIDANGNPTDDPTEIYRGAISLPFAAHKGYGFAVMVELLSAVLAGAGITKDVHSWNKAPGRDANTGHCFIVINPEFFGGLDEFKKRTDLLIDRLVATPPAPGVDRVRYPGEIEFEHEAEALKFGVPLPQSSVDELRRAAKLTGVKLDF